MDFLNMEWRKTLRRLLGRDPDFKSRLCYAQDGEDLIMDRFLDGQQNGFYIDIGAHHPMRFSNTYLFYRRGWTGINIDAQPGSMKEFRRLRPRDTNLECGVAGTAGRMAYYQFNEPALNTFDQREAELKNRSPYRLTGCVEVEVQPLATLLDRHLPAGQSIDFMTVDVEGKDFEVLKSNDWTRYRPRFVLAETLRTSMLSMADCPLAELLRNEGYRAVAKAYNTTFFHREDA